jgi:hypothetical protein
MLSFGRHASGASAASLSLSGWRTKTHLKPLAGSVRGSPASRIPLAAAARMTPGIAATMPPMGRQPACIQVEARPFDRKPWLAVLRHAMSVRL